jgi:hypothetical protein
MVSRIWRAPRASAGSSSGVALMAMGCVLALPMARAAAADEPTLVHPIFAQLPDAPEEDAARQAFTAAAGRYQLRPVEIVDVPAPPAPRAPDALHLGILHAQQQAFAEALRELDTAAAEVAATGGAGLSTAELGDLYLYRAMATARADWNAKAATPPTEERTRAYADYLRAATMAPDRAASPTELPPQVVADFQRAVEEIHHRPRGTLVIKGSADAQIALDDGPLMRIAGSISFRDLTFGEHLVRAEELGYAPWGATVSFGQATLEVLIPARAPLALDDATAAAHARRMGARFALVAQPKGGPGTPVEVRLVDAATGALRDAALTSTSAQGGQVDAAVMRLDEEARRLALEQQTAANAPGSSPSTPPATAGAPLQLGPPLLLAQPPARARFSADPPAWARDHWPLLTAVGAVLLTAIVLGAAVSSDR